MNKKMIDLFHEYDFQVAVSIDGGEEIQNKQRPLRNNGNSYLETIKELKYLFQKVPKTVARGTYFDFSTSLVKNYRDLLSLGFTEVNIVPDILDIKTNEECKQLGNELDSLYYYILEYIETHSDFPFGLFKTRMRMLFTDISDLTYDCGLGKKIFSVDSNGDIFPCHRFSEMPSYVMGNVNNKTLIEKNIETDCVTCNKCWNRHTCSHGCLYEDYKTSKYSIKKNTYFCWYSKKMTQLCIALCSKLDEDKIWNIIGFSNSIREQDYV